MKKYQKSIMAALLLLFGILLFFIIIPTQTRSTENVLIDASFLPYAVSILIIIFSTYILIQELREKMETKNSDYKDKSTTSYLRILLVFIILIIWGVILLHLGFVLTSLLTTAIFMIIMGNRKWYLIVSVPIIFTVVAIVIFRMVLNINLPSGIFL